MSTAIGNLTASINAIATSTREATDLAHLTKQEADSGARELGLMNANLREAIDGLYTTAGELEFRGLVGIEPARWREMTASESSKWVTCVVPADTAEPALLAATQSDSVRAAQ